LIIDVTKHWIIDWKTVTGKACVKRSSAIWIYG